MLIKPTKRSEQFKQVDKLEIFSLKKVIKIFVKMGGNCI
jgi:hypothetical protein